MTINQPKPPSMRVRTLFMLRRIIPPLDKEQRAEVRIKLHDASHPSFDFFLLTILSSVIATLGLLTDSAAVIIGAMLVAPLMSPIIGLGLGSLIGDTHLIQHAASALIRGAILAVLMAILLTWSNRFLPFIALQELPGEVISRTHPSPIDLTIALAGGLAAAYALALPSLSAALPGVAIATALMPPLCAVGIGVALGNWETAGGALLLFVTNAVTIAFAAMLIFFILGFRPGRQEGRRLPRTLLASAVVTAILLVPLTYMGADFFRQASENRMINTIIIEEIENMGAEMATLDLISSSGSQTLNMTITVRTPRTLSYQDVINLQRAIATRLQRPVAIKINQVFTARLDPLIPPTFTPTSTPPTFTPTATFTSTPTPTSTPTFTPTFTPTYTPTPTPALGKVINSNGRTIDILQRPEGPSIGKLRPDTIFTILYGSEVTNGLVWIEIMDSEGRIGWIPQIYLLEVTLTPTATPTLTPTP